MQRIYKIGDRVVVKAEYAPSSARRAPLIATIVRWDGNGGVVRFDDTRFGWENAGHVSTAPAGPGYWNCNWDWLEMLEEASLYEMD